MSMDYFSTDLELKTVSLPQRLISGYAAIHSTVDRVRDIIDPGASAKAVARLASPSAVAVFEGHNTKALPVGIPQIIQATPQGLYTETYILKGPVGDNLLAVAKDLIDHGQTLGLSIGYKTKDSRMERVASATGTKSVRRLLDYELVELSYAASQAIAHPEALVTAVKTALGTASASEKPATSAQYPSAAPLHLSPIACSQSPEQKAQSDERARRRAAAAAEQQRCDREERTERAEAEVRRARMAEYGAQLDDIGRYLLDQTQREVDERARARERSSQLMEQLREVADAPIPMTRTDREEFFAQLDRESAAREAAEDHQRFKDTDAALSRRTWDYAFRQSWDRRHPGGVDKCSCDGCRSYRREPPR